LGYHPCVTGFLTGLRNPGAEHRQAEGCAEKLKELGMRVFSGEHQAGTISFVPPMDCEGCAEALAREGIAVRAGLHCAPLAHESAGTLETGTVRISFGPDAAAWQVDAFVSALRRSLGTPGARIMSNPNGHL